VQTSPLDTIRQKLGLQTVRELAEVTGCRYHAVHQACRGMGPIPRAAYTPLQELGVDVPRLVEDHAAFVADRAGQLRAALKARLEGQAT
jgi:hypothetical protein